VSYTKRCHLAGIAR